MKIRELLSMIFNIFKELFKTDYKSIKIDKSTIIKYLKKIILFISLLLFVLFLIYHDNDVYEVHNTILNKNCTTYLLIFAIILNFIFLIFNIKNELLLAFFASSISFIVRIIKSISIMNYEMLSKKNLGFGFKIYKKWTLDELSIYLENLLSKKRNLIDCDLTKSNLLQCKEILKQNGITSPEEVRLLVVNLLKEEILNTKMNLNLLVLDTNISIPLLLFTTIGIALYNAIMFERLHISYDRVDVFLTIFSVGVSCIQHFISNAFMEDYDKKVEELITKGKEIITKEKELMIQELESEYREDELRKNSL